jgi:hypothetical protein
MGGIYAHFKLEKPPVPAFTEQFQGVSFSFIDLS